ncbi:hypothetical protein B0O99DRAFT_269476 [Bisporella sp. PMI_857]|nr:hypothetical protein B0O99DRAFT_269476 [Bisporella sp. PMI_857]
MNNWDSTQNIAYLLFVDGRSSVSSNYSVLYEVFNWWVSFLPVHHSQYAQCIIDIVRDLRYGANIGYSGALGLRPSMLEMARARSHAASPAYAKCKMWRSLAFSVEFSFCSFPRNRDRICRLKIRSVETGKSLSWNLRPISKIPSTRGFYPLSWYNWSGASTSFITTTQCIFTATGSMSGIHITSSAMWPTGQLLCEAS